MENKAQIIYNAIRCPDGTVIESKHRWDYVEHLQEDGRRYAVDGGDAYLRRAVSDDKYEEISLTTSAPHEEIREVFSWTSIKGKDGEELPEPVTRKLKDLDDGHVLALVEFTESGYPKYIQQIFINESKFRGLTS
jgi:hypothetical protein